MDVDITTRLNQNLASPLGNILDIILHLDSPLYKPSNELGRNLLNVWLPQNKTKAVVSVATSPTPCDQYLLRECHFGIVDNHLIFSSLDCLLKYPKVMSSLAGQSRKQRAAFQAVENSFSGSKMIYTRYCAKHVPVIMATDRKSVVQGKSVDLGGRRIIKK